MDTRSLISVAVLGGSLVLCTAGSALAGEIVVDPGNGGEIILLDAADPHHGARDAVRENNARAKSYVAPPEWAGGNDTIVIVPARPAGGVPDPARANAEALRHNRTKAKSYAKDKPVPESGAKADGTTVIIIPLSDSPAVGRPDTMQIDPQTQLENNNAKARDYLRGCRDAPSGTAIGTIAGSTGDDSSVIIFSDGVNTYVGDGNCK